MQRKLRLKSARTLWIVLVIGLVAVILVTPSQPIGPTEFRPSSYNTGAGGASGFYEAASRLKWPVTRRESNDLAVHDGVFVSLSTPQQLTPSEVHVLLEQVRRGAGLLVAAPAESPIADSLGIGSARASGAEIPPNPALDRCPGARSRISWTLPAELLNILAIRPIRKSPLADSSGVPLLPLLSPLKRDGVSAARGIHYGAGRIVAMADPRPLLNDVFRQCTLNASVLSVRVLEFLSEGKRPTLVFDEYRHGHGQHEGSLQAMASLFIETGSGRGLLQLLAAGVILLLATGSRALAPRAPGIIERRSPFEHLSALAAAYSRAGATRLATGKLVRGLRRRMPGAVTSGHHESDEEFLDAIPELHPELRQDVARVRAALIAKTTPADFLAVGTSIEKIERSLKA